MQILFLRLEISALLLQRKFQFEFRKIQNPNIKYEAIQF